MPAPGTPVSSSTRAAAALNSSSVCGVGSSSGVGTGCAAPPQRRRARQRARRAADRIARSLPLVSQPQPPVPSRQPVYSVPPWRSSSCARRCTGPTATPPASPGSRTTSAGSRTPKRSCSRPRSGVRDRRCSTSGGFGLPRVEAHIRYEAPVRIGHDAAHRHRPPAGEPAPPALRLRDDAARTTVCASPPGFVRVGCVDLVDFTPRDLPDDVVAVRRSPPGAGRRPSARAGPRCPGRDRRRAPRAARRPASRRPEPRRSPEPRAPPTEKAGTAGTTTRRSTTGRTPARSAVVTCRSGCG